MKCPYPGCRASFADDVFLVSGEEPVGEEFCAEHQAITCRYPLYEPLCQERPIPRSVYCGEHDKVASFVKGFHAALHQEAAVRQQQIALNAQLERNVRKDLFGGRN